MKSPDQTRILLAAGVSAIALTAHAPALAQTAGAPEETA